jgi:hypothetical protein
MPLTSAEVLCEACLDLFGEDRYDLMTEHYRHHDTAEAFSRALELPCALCTRILFFHPRYLDDEVVTSIADFVPLVYMIKYANQGDMYYMQFETNDNYFISIQFEPCCSKIPAPCTYLDSS